MARRGRLWPENGRRYISNNTSPEQRFDAETGEAAPPGAYIYFAKVDARKARQLAGLNPFGRPNRSKDAARWVLEQPAGGKLNRTQLVARAATEFNVSERQIWAALKTAKGH